MIDALLYHGMREWSPRGICGRTRDFRSRDGACRGLARRRQASPLALTPGADRCPGHVSDRAPFFLQTPVERSERLAGGWAVRAPFPSGLALHPEVRFTWELGWPP